MEDIEVLPHLTSELPIFRGLEKVSERHFSFLMRDTLETCILHMDVTNTKVHNEESRMFLIVTYRHHFPRDLCQPYAYRAQRRTDNRYCLSCRAALGLSVQETPPSPRHLLPSCGVMVTGALAL